LSSHASPTLSVGSWEGILWEITKHDYSPSPGLCELTHMPILCEVFRDLALESEELDSVAWYRKFNPSHASPTLSVGSWEGFLGEITKHDYSPARGLC